MYTNKLRFGLLGCGAAGSIHAAAIAELVMVCDTDADAAERLGSKCRVRHTHDPDVLLNDPAIEAVTVALPHHLHREYALKCALAGKSAIIEKPFTLNREDGQSVVAAFQRQGLFVSAWLERRYNPFAVRTKELVEQNRFGRVIYVAINTMGYKQRSYWEYGMRNEDGPSNWRKQWATAGGGPLLMNAIHQIDLACWITGLEITEVFARMATFFHPVEVEDTISVQLLFSNGALGRIDCSCAAFGAGFFPIEQKRDYIYGVDGYAYLTTPLETCDRLNYHQKHELPKLSVAECKTLAIRDFVRAVRERDSAAMLAESAIRANAVVAAAYRSAREGKPIPVENASAGTHA
jgi:predicted dehydrogenase